MATGAPHFTSTAPTQAPPSQQARPAPSNIWLCFLLYGVSLVVLGMVAMSATFITGLAVVWVLGVFLLVGGCVQIATAITARGSGFWAHLIGGIIYAVVGLLMIEHPLQAVVGITLMIAAALLVGGAIRIAMALTERFPGRGMVLANGVISLILGIMLWRRWPEDSAWVIGLFTGIEMLMSGAVWIMLALGLRSATQPA